MNIIDPIKALLAEGIEAALTLWPEWQLPIEVLGDKGVENRSWPIPAKYVGRCIAFHWGAHVGGSKSKNDKRYGTISVLRTAMHAGWKLQCTGQWTAELEKGGRRVSFDADKLTLGAIGSIVRITGLTKPGPVRPDDPYYAGEYGWRFELVRKLETPIPCKGAQGLWPLRSLLGEECGRPQAGKAWA